MSKGGIIVLVVAALVFAALGFTLGQFFNASVIAPGSADDPLVSESYVNRYVGDKLADMQMQIDALEAEIIRLTGSSPLNNYDDAYPSDPNSTDDGTGTGSGSGTTGGSTTTVSSVTIKEGTVNVRSSASQDGELITTVTAETKLDFLGQQPDSEGRTWYKVRLSTGTEGWVAGWLCYDPE